MTNRNRTALAVIVSLLVALFAFGCSDDDTTNFVSPTDPGLPVIVFLGGQCRAAPTRVECEDESRSEPRNELSAITFELRDSATGLSVERRSADPQSGVPREVSFAGVSPGTYEVRHQVVATDGGTVTTVYSGLVVGL